MSKDRLPARHYIGNQREDIREEQLSGSTRQIEARAAADPVVSRLKSVPGVGPVTALTYVAAIEDPHRFVRCADVGAYAGLVPRRNQSGERDTSGHIARAGDAMLRRALYEAVNSLLSLVKRRCALREWGMKLAEAKGSKRARTALARKLAVLLHRLWLDESEFNWA